MIISCVSSASNFISNHCELGRDLSLIALNTVMLASKIFKNVPPILSSSSLVLLNAFSVYYWKDYQIPDWLKHVRDLKYACYYREIFPALLTAARVTVKAVNILLTAGLLVASLTAFAGFPIMMASMYSFMSPFAFAGLIGTLSGEVIDYFENGKALKKLQEFERDATAAKIHLFVHRFMELSSHSLWKKTPNCADDETLHLALYAVRQFEQYNFVGFEKKCVNQTTQAIFEMIKGQLEINRKCVDDNLMMTCYNYVILGICKLYPDDLIKYALYLSSSVFYMIKNLRHKDGVSANS